MRDRISFSPRYIWTTMTAIYRLLSPPVRYISPHFYLRSTLPLQLKLASDVGWMSGNDTNSIRSAHLVYIMKRHGLSYAKRNAENTVYGETGFGIN